MFFSTNFLVREGFLKKENFVGLFGLVGLAECTNHILGLEDPELDMTDINNRFGKSSIANELGEEIIKKLSGIVFSS